MRSSEAARKRAAVRTITSPWSASQMPGVKSTLACGSAPRGCGLRQARRSPRVGAPSAEGAAAVLHGVLPGWPLRVAPRRGRGPRSARAGMVYGGSPTSGKTRGRTPRWAGLRTAAVQEATCDPAAHELLSVFGRASPEPRAASAASGKPRPSLAPRRAWWTRRV